MQSASAGAVSWAMIVALSIQTFSRLGYSVARTYDGMSAPHAW